MDPFTGFAVGKALKIGGETANNYYNWENHKDQREWDKQWTLDQMNIQRQWALEDWTRQNQYDSFLEQKKRLQQAGLNTNLLYGGHVSSASNDIRPVNVGNVNRQPFRADNPVGGIANEVGSLAINMQQLKNMEAQQDLLMAQTNSTNANTFKAMADTEYTKTQNTQMQQTFNDVLQGIQLTNEKIKSEVGVNLATEDKVKAETTRTEVLTDLAKKMAELERGKTKAETDKILQEIVNLKLDEKKKEWENSLQDQQKKKLEEEIKQLEALRSISQDESLMKAAEERIFHKYGVTRSDPAFWRIYIKSLETTGDKINQRKGPRPHW